MATSEQPPESREAVLAQAKHELDTLIGLPGVKEEVNRLLSFLKIQLERRRLGLRETSLSLHFVFTGNPGTGKTTVARILGKIFYGFGMLKTAKVVECDRSKFVGGYLGQTAIKTDEIIQSALDGVLFIDEAYTLAGDSGKFGHGDMYGEEAINTLLKQMEDSRDRLIVIVAGYPALMETFLRSNPGLHSRFTRFIRFDDYSVPDLCRIFDKFCRDSEYSLTPLACANAFMLFTVAFHKRNERFGNARFVRNVYEIAVSRQSDRLAKSGGELSKANLEAIDGRDIRDIPLESLTGFDATGFDPRTVDLIDSRWDAECPGCRKAFAGGRIKLLGQRVTCACGQKFTYPWWNLVRDTAKGLPAELLLASSPSDKLGIAEAAPATAEPKRSVVIPSACNNGLVDMTNNEIEVASRYPNFGEQEVAAAFYGLGLMHLDADGVTQSDTQAIVWFRRAAEKGNADAQYRLGQMYGKGHGVRQSAGEAAVWYRKAAMQGHSVAQYCLAEMYEYGDGVNKSVIEAALWFRKSADQGWDLAQTVMGEFYLDGRGVPQSDSKAAAWFQKAAEQGNAAAQSLLGSMYRDGRGVRQSDAQAAEWFWKAAEQGDTSAQWNLGCVYENGQGVRQSISEAIAWYRKAADKGYRLAQYSLGKIYEEGRGVRQDKQEAILWYQKSADLGSELAKEALRRCAGFVRLSTRDH